VDDDTLLFRAAAPPRQPGDTLEFYLYLWRLGEAPKPHTNPVVASVGSYCAGNGIVSYRQEKRDPSTGQYVRYLMKGPPGQEREVAAPARGELTPPSRSRIETAHCEPYSDVQMKDRIWVIDPDRQFRLDFGPTRASGRQAHPVTLLRADGGRVELPVSSTDVFPSCTHFHRYDGAFLIWNCIGANPARPNSWQETNCAPVWRIEPPDGRTTKVCLPHGKWAGLIELVPTKGGLFFTSLVARKDDVQAPGLYRLQGGSATRILAGLINEPVVSPSGCKVVMRYSPDLGTPTIVATDLCAAK
jgi:hypothetical protein